VGFALSEASKKVRELSKSYTLVSEEGAIALRVATYLALLFMLDFGDFELYICP
jgi:hypothetical protein